MAPEVALQLATALREFWYLRGYFKEGRSWLAEALASSSKVLALTRGRALIGAGKFAWVQGDYDQATIFASESLNLFRFLEDIQNVANSLNLLGLIALYQNEMNQARSLFEQSLALHREVGGQFDIADTVLDLGLIAMYQNNYSQAKLLLEESLAISHLKKDRVFTGLCLNNLGYNELYRGNLSDATAHFREAISISLSQKDWETVVWCLEGFAEIAGAALDNQNSLHVAACLFGAAQTFRNTLGIPLSPMDRPYYESSLSMLRSKMSEAAFAAAWAEGAAMSLEEAVAYAPTAPTNA